MRKILRLAGGFILSFMAVMMLLIVHEKIHPDGRTGVEPDYAFCKLSPILDGGSLAFVFKSKNKTMTLLAQHGCDTKESSPHRYNHIVGDNLNLGAEIIAYSVEEGEIIAWLEKSKLRDKAVAHDLEHVIECLKNRQVCPWSFKWEEFSKRCR